MKEIHENIKNSKGYCEYRITDENVEITNLFIEPKFRRQGEGKKMVDEVIENSEGKACVYLFTRQSNKSARAFYEAMGFREVCEIEGFYRSEPGIMYIKTR